MFGNFPPQYGALKPADYTCHAASRSLSYAKIMQHESKNNLLIFAELQLILCKDTFCMVLSTKKSHFFYAWGTFTATCAAFSVPGGFVSATICTQVYPFHIGIFFKPRELLFGIDA